MGTMKGELAKLADLDRGNASVSFLERWEKMKE
jgi:hypothetical protein